MGQFFMKGYSTQDCPKHDGPTNDNGNGLHGLDAQGRDKKRNDFGGTHGQTSQYRPLDAFPIKGNYFGSSFFDLDNSIEESDAIMNEYKDW